jgi:outer membrane receptor protein involved in Fe transport
MRWKPRTLVTGVSLAFFVGSSTAALAQTPLPEVQVNPPPVATPQRKTKRAAKSKVSASRQGKAAVAPSAASSGSGAASAASSSGAGSQTGQGGQSGPSPALVAQTQALDAARAQIFAPVGANTFSMSSADISNLPAGQDTPFDKVLLQAPGFSQDSAASGSLHLRNEHANLQYRINGVLLPDGVSGFTDFLDSGFIGNVNIVDGVLPSQYGQHTTGIIDITPKNGVFNGGGSISVSGGSRGTISPFFEYGGTFDQTQYYVAGRYFGSNEGIENPAPTIDAIHDDTDQGKFFGYVSTVLGDGSRLSLISGASDGAYQIPNNPGQTPAFTTPGFPPIDSSQLNENQYEQNYYNVLSWQKSTGALDMQVSAFSRYSSLNFLPDPIGDLQYNGVASNVFRSSFLNGVMGDGAYRLNNSHTLRFGFTGSGENATADNESTVFPVDGDGNVNGPPFAAPAQQDNKTGWLFGAYLQDEWRITDKLTLNAGLRFDQMYGYVDANQFSPRVSATYKPTENTTFHAGYARYFTPPELSLSAPTNLANFANTTLQPGVALDDPVQPERSNYFDVGVDQKIMPGLTAGLDAYYKVATDLLDDGQFGQALTLTAFNYAHGWNEGVEGKVEYDANNLRVYTNVAWGHQYATNVVSNQFLFDPDEFAYIANHYIPTDHSQTWTGSAGASYLWNGTTYTADMIFGSGLRNGFANLSTVPAYAQINVGLSHAFKWSPDRKPLTVRFNIVNLFDTVYQIRDGTGIGVFAPQYGPRRGFFVSLAQAL